MERKSPASTNPRSLVITTDSLCCAYAKTASSDGPPKPASTTRSTECPAFVSWPASDFGTPPLPGGLGPSSRWPRIPRPKQDVRHILGRHKYLRAAGHTNPSLVRMVIPPPSCPRIKSTSMRVPWITGFPPLILGSAVIPGAISRTIHVSLAIVYTNSFRSCSAGALEPILKLPPHRELVLQLQPRVAWARRWKLLPLDATLLEEVGNEDAGRS